MTNICVCQDVLLVRHFEMSARRASIAIEWCRITLKSDDAELIDKCLAQFEPAEDCVLNSVEDYDVYPSMTIPSNLTITKQVLNEARVDHDSTGTNEEPWLEPGETQIDPSKRRAMLGLILAHLYKQHVSQIGMCTRGIVPMLDSVVIGFGLIGVIVDESMLMDDDDDNSDNNHVGFACAA